MDGHRLLTLNEVAGELRVSRRSVERIIRSGHLRVVRPVPGRTLVEARELEAYLAWMRQSR